MDNNQIKQSGANNSTKRKNKKKNKNHNRAVQKNTVQSTHGNWDETNIEAEGKEIEIEQSDKEIEPTENEITSSDIENLSIDPEKDRNSIEKSENTENKSGTSKKKNKKMQQIEKKRAHNSKKERVYDHNNDKKRKTPADEQLDTDSNNTSKESEKDFKITTNISETKTKNKKFIQQSQQKQKHPEKETMDTDSNNKSKESEKDFKLTTSISETKTKNKKFIQQSQQKHSEKETKDTENSDEGTWETVPWDKKLETKNAFPPTVKTNQQDDIEDGSGEIEQTRKSNNNQRGSQSTYNSKGYNTEQTKDRYQLPRENDQKKWQRSTPNMNHPNSSDNNSPLSSRQESWRTQKNNVGRNSTEFSRNDRSRDDRRSSENNSSQKNYNRSYNSSLDSSYDTPKEKDRRRTNDNYGSNRSSNGFNNKSRDSNDNRSDYNRSSDDYRFNSSANKSFLDNEDNTVDVEILYNQYQKELKDNKLKFMKVEEVEKDLFLMPKEYSLAHCVAEDMAMGSGIAVHFRRDFKRVDELLNQRQRQGGLAVLEDGDRFIYYLVTKKFSSGKPTYLTLFCSLLKMKTHIEENNVQYLAMPRIGCGLDRLEWTDVKIMLEFIFKDTDLHIVVCNFQQDENSTVTTPKRHTNCWVVNVDTPIEQIDVNTLIIYFSDQEGTISKEMEQLDKKFNILQKFRNHPKKLGETIKHEPNHDYTIFGCIVREWKDSPLNFVALQKCIGIINRENAKMEFVYVGFQAIFDKDKFVNNKIVNIVRNTFKNVEVYVCYPDDLKSLMPPGRA